VQVHHDEGVAIYIGPEPCVGVREDGDEASVGEGIGQPLSRESNPRVPTPFRVRKATRFGRTIARSERPGVVEEPGMCRRSLRGNREISRSTVRQLPPVSIGKARSRSR
jgi:hypothetical protein